MQDAEDRLLEPAFLTVRQTARKFGVSELTIRRYVMDGHVPSIKLGTKRLIPISFVNDKLAEAKGGDADDPH